MSLLRVESATKGAPVRSLRALAFWLGFAVVFGAFAWMVTQKERHLAQGQRLILQLAPKDPRSLMTGDYMRLDTALARAINEVIRKDTSGLWFRSWNSLPADASDAQRAKFSEYQRRDGFAVVRADATGVAHLQRLQVEKLPLQPEERLVHFRVRTRWGGPAVGSDAFYFQEGTGHAYEAARYGAYQLSAEGELLLVDLLDQKFQRIAAPAGITLKH